MHIPSWTVACWPQVECYVTPRRRILPRLHHATTTCRTKDEGLRAGHTTWVGRVGESCVGVAWEWCEIRPGVPVMEDANSVVTNLRFLDAASETYLEHLQSLVALHRMIHATRWQDAVLSVIRGGQLAAAEQSLRHAA